MRFRVLLLALGLCLAATSDTFAQGEPKKPGAIFQAAREYLNGGSLELAAETLKDFLNSKPTDQDYLDLETKYGATAFQKLRNVPRWLADGTKDAEFKKTVIEGIIQGSTKANEKLLRDPTRILKFVKNLGESREERDFAIAELNRSGDAVVPILVENMRINNTPEYRGGAMTAVTRLNAEVIPGLIVAAENLPGEFKTSLLNAFASRPDVIGLLGKADSNFVPYLWYLATDSQSSGVRDLANNLLRTLSNDLSDRQTVDRELIKYATPMFERKGNFSTLDKAKNRVKIWTWDASANNVKSVELPPNLAEEQLGLKYLKWAIERQPSSDAAQELFLSLATERAVERANFADITRTDPAVSQLLAAAPANMLTQILESALAENRTALAYGIIQAIGNRGDTNAVIPQLRPGATEPKPGPLVKALNYSDPRVQLAAAAAILKMPSVDHGANTRIVDILKRAAATDPAASPDSQMGRAIIADPVSVRGDQIATLLRGIGFTTEVFGTGRDLTKRVNRDSHFDLVIVDRHIVQPELSDVLSQLTANANVGRRPILVVASSDKPQAVSVELLLLRLGILIAATETTEIQVPPPYEDDPRKSSKDNGELRKKNIDLRDGRLLQIANGRLTRMKRIVDASRLGNGSLLQSRLELRMPQLTQAIAIAEYDPTPEFAPSLFLNVKSYTLLLQKQPELAKSLVGVPTEELIRLTSQLETVITKEVRSKVDLLTGKMNQEELLLPQPSAIDPIVEIALRRIVRPYSGVGIIAEPFAAGLSTGSVPFGLAHDIQTVIVDPASRPRDPNEKKAATKLAVEWLKRLATGEHAGYDLKPAVPALRQALATDDLAENAIEALSRISVAEAQQDLARLASSAARPAALRNRAIEAAIRHYQSFGKLTTPEVNIVVTTAQSTETNAEIKAKLSYLAAALAGQSSGDLLAKLKAYNVPTSVPEKAPEKKPDDAKPATEKQ